MKTTFCVEVTVPRGMSVALVSPLIDAKDEKQAVEFAHKQLTAQGFQKEGRNVIRVKPVYVLNRRAIMHASSSL